MPSRPPSLWRDLDFLKLWIGQTISEIGSRITIVALPLVAVLILNARPSQMGMLAGIGIVKGESFTPVAGLIKSGALDLSKPGNLAKFMPKRPAVLVEAHDDIIVIDLMKNPKFAENDRVRGILGTLTPVVNVSGLSTEGDFLILQLRASPFGLPRALNAARALAAG